MASHSPTSPLLDGSSDALPSPSASRQPVPRCDSAPVSILSRRRRRRRRRPHASPIDADSTLTPNSSSTGLPILNQLQSFPPLQENGSLFRRLTGRFLAHVARFVRGGTAIFWQLFSPASRPTSPSTSSSIPPSEGPQTSWKYSIGDLTPQINDDDDIGGYAKAIHLPTARLGAQAIPISCDYASYMSLSSAILIFPPINYGEQSLSPELASLNCSPKPMCRPSSPELPSPGLLSFPFNGFFPS